MKSRKDILNFVTSQLSKAQAQLEMIQAGGVIQMQNTICFFTASNNTIMTTGGEGEERKCLITPALFASQFTPEDAARICANVKDGNGNSPVAISPEEYYKIKVNSLTDCIVILKEQ